MRAEGCSRYVGRVGALAVALGVGTAILGWTAVAGADTGAGNAAGSAGEESTRSADSARAAGKTRPGSRRSAADRDHVPPAAGRRSAGVRSGLTATEAEVRNAGTASVAASQSPADLLGALFTPGGMTGLVRDALSSLIVAASAAPSAVEITSATQIADTAVAPAVMTAQPDALSVAHDAALDALGGVGGTGDPLAAPLAWAALAVTQRESASGTAEVAPVASVTTGEPVDPLAAGTAAAGQTYQDFPEVPKGCSKLNTVCDTLVAARYIAVNNLARSFASAFKLDPPTNCAFGKGCPLEGQPPAVSVPNTVGMYAFNVVYALMGGLPDSTVASTVTALVNQPVVLGFISQTVAAKFPNLPPSVSALIGSAAATFALNSFGNQYVAEQFVPFLNALNLPTNPGPAKTFVEALKKDSNAALLSNFNSTQGQQALIGFFGNPKVQAALGAAFGDSVKVLLVPAVADYIGQQAATNILGADNPNLSALSATIGNAVSGLFASIGGMVATQAGTAFATLLRQGPLADQPTVANTLANAMVNGFVTFLKGDAPFPEVPVLPAIAPAAGVAVTGFVQAVLSTPSVPPALGAFANQLIPGMLANPGVQGVVAAQVAGAVTNALGGDALAAAVGTQAGAAAGNLVAVPVIQTALTTWVNSLFGSILASPQAVTALANAAGQLVTADLNGTAETVRPQVIESLRKTPAIDTAVGQAVTSGVTALFGNAEILTAVNNAAVTLITAALSDPAVQRGLGERVSDDVAKAFNYSAFGEAAGAQAGAAVVSFVSNPDIRSALVGLVDTMVGDFFSTPGVVPAVAKAAGDIAAATLAENPAAAQAATAALRANGDVQKGIGNAVGSAVRAVLTDPKVLAALDKTASSLVSGLLSDPAVQAGLSKQVANDVSTALGGGALGQAVGAQVGSAVTGLLSQQAVRDALAKLVDTELGDFFRADGVVDAFVVAADTFALDVVSSGDTRAAAQAAEQSLRASTAVQDAVGGIVTASVKNLLDDSTLWSAFDAAAVRLVGGLLADPAVQAGVSDRVYTTVWTAFNGTALGVAVADQVSTAVVELMKNPDLSAGLVGVVDTVLTDFFGTAGVVTAFSTAAGELASAAVAGTLSTVEPAVLSELRANTAVQTGVNRAVGDAVTALLTDPKVVSALNDKLASLVSDLLGDPDVQAGLNEGVAKAVSNLFGGGPLGEAVGAQVGTAVVEILSNPTVKDALEGLVDTELGDFFRSDGVVTAFAAAADTFALGVFTGEKVNAAAEAAVKQLRTSPAVDTAVQKIVTTAVGGLLGDVDVWTAVDGTASRLVADLVDDPDVQQAVAGKVYAAVWVAFNGTPLGQAVGDQAAAAVVSLMQNPDVQVALVELVDTMSRDFFGYPGVVTAFSTAAGELAAAAVAGTLATVGPVVQQELRANTAVEQAAGVAVGDAVFALVTDPNVLSALDDTASELVGGLLDDPTVQARLDAQITADVSKFLGGGTLGQTVGAQTATAVMTFLADPNVRAALLGLVDTELGDFFTSAGVADAFAEAADMFTVEVVTGESVKTAANEAIEWLRTSAPVDDAVNGIVTDSVANVLSNPYVIGAFDDGLTTLLNESGPYAGQVVAVLVTRSLGASPIAAPVGEAVGAAVQQLVATPGFGPAVVTIITGIVPDFLGQFGVPTAVGSVAGEYAASIVAYGDPKVAEQTALNALRTNPTIAAAAKETVADSLNLVDTTLLGNPAIQQALGATVTTLITTLAPDPAIQAFVAERDGPALAELLTDGPVVGEIATVVGSVVTQLLAYPGFSTALTDAVGQFADGVIDGQTVSEAQQSALRGLQSAPAVVKAVDAVIPPAVSGLLGYSNVRQAAGVVAQEDIIASLKKSGINNRFVDRTVGQVADGTVESLLGRPAGVNLVDDLVINVMLGMPVRDWRGFTAQEVVAKPSLQIALGMSIGQGIGSLFGDNVVAQLIGVAAGIPVTLVIGVGSAIIGFFQWIFGAPGYGAPALAA